MITLSRESVARRWRGAWREVLTQLKCPSDARGGWGRHRALRSLQQSSPSAERDAFVVLPAGGIKAEP